jgi:Uma2 family endonuclease
VSKDRWALDREIPEVGDWEVIPDLAVEVISPNEVHEDVLMKVNEYFAFGVRTVWVVVPRTREIYVYRTASDVRILTATDELDGGDLLPGFRLPLADLFRRQAVPAVEAAPPG